jgi:organic hydroperoxide reductase OsmC/OhrA
LQVAIPDVDKEVARELLDKAHQVYPYSNATRDDITIELELV